MGKVKLLLDVIGDLRSLSDSLQAVADAVADSGAAEAEMTTTGQPLFLPEEEAQETLPHGDIAAAHDPFCRRFF